MRYIFCLVVAFFCASCATDTVKRESQQTVPLQGTWVYLKEMDGVLQQRGQIVIGQELVVMSFAEFKATSSRIMQRQQDPITGAGFLELQNGYKIILSPGKIVIPSGKDLKVVDILETQITDGNQKTRNLQLHTAAGAALAVYSDKLQAKARLAEDVAQVERSESDVIKTQKNITVDKETTFNDNVDQKFAQLVEIGAPDFLSDTEHMISLAGHHDALQLNQRSYLISNQYRQRILKDLIVARHSQSAQRQALLLQSREKQEQLSVFESSYSIWLAKK